MEGEEFVEVPGFSNSGFVSEKYRTHVPGGEADSLPLKSEAKSDVNGEASRVIPDDTCESGIEALETEFVPENTRPINEINQEACGTIDDSFNENKKAHMTTDMEKDAVNKISTEPVDFEMTETVAVVNELTSISSVNTENGSLAVESKIISSIHNKNGTLRSSQEIDNGPISGVKRPRITVDEQEPSVHVIYSSLTSESKRKLEELLQQWSRWHAQNCSLSNDSNTVIESGEKIYFPALHVGVDKPSQVTFWVDNQTNIQLTKEFIPLDGNSVPLYDRGYSLALTSGDGSGSLDGGVEKLDTSRCFNCSSYGHALKDCPKPRDNAAVNNARKQHKSKRNQNANSRNSARYYQSSRGGKYDGLMPGVLDPETRQLLGIGELDPPPWLTRMREIGYPPGYLDTDEEQPSGITIFGDEPNKEEGEEGEILGMGPSEPTRKMSVQFPGINAPIPEKADERLWAAASSSSATTLSRDHLHSHRRDINNNYNHSSDNLSSRVNYHEPPRWSTDLDDERPPGCDPWTSPSLSNHYRRYDHDYDRDSGYNSLSRSNRYGDYDSPRTSTSQSPWSPTFGRSSSDRGRRSPLIQDENPKYGQYGSYPYSSPR